MFCKSCGQELKEGQAVCLNCGVKVGNGVKYCAHCGKPVNPEAEICLSCGMKLKKQGLDNVTDSVLSDGWVPTGKSSLIAILLCLFLGGLGIHNFYLGETKKGVIKIIFLFILGISTIFALIDLIKMVIGKYEVNPNKAF